MVSLGSCQHTKRILYLTKAKLLYTKITLTRYTAFYLLFALVTCLILTALQSVTFIHNSAAVNALEGVITRSNASEGIAIFKHGRLQICSSIPGQIGTICTTRVILSEKPDLDEGARVAEKVLRTRKDAVPGSDLEHPQDVVALASDLAMTKSSISFEVDDVCVVSLQWLSDVLHDAKREDVVTFVFHIWSFSLAFVTVLNESIPHLVAGLMGHILGAAWASYRLTSTNSLMKTYRSVLVPGTCYGLDFLGDWWEVRSQHATGIVIVNWLTVVSYGYLSFKLFKVYATQSFSRVGASEKIYRIYKMVLLFSVCLQLSGFFTLASTALWIDKMCRGTMKDLAKDASLHLAAFIVMFVVQLPWLYFGWICVRKEQKWGFGIFFLISVFLLSLSTAMFSNNLCQYIFATWPFFVSVSVTAYVLLVATTVLGVVCRLNFGKGLAHYLHVTEALEGVDFTPVFFPRQGGEDTEKYGEHKSSPYDTTPYPSLAYHQTTKGRGSSIYSQPDITPVMLSSSPPLLSDLGPIPKRSRPSETPQRRSVASSARSLSSRSSGERSPKPAKEQLAVRFLPRQPYPKAASPSKSSPFYTPNGSQKISRPSPVSGPRRVKPASFDKRVYF